jgi:arsenite-transporting ATPase
VPELTFFIGKGGVGKTSVSAAYAVRRASQRPRASVLLLSTDPAHSLADVLQARLGDRASAVPVPRGSIHAWQLNAEKEFRKFLARYEDDLLATVEAGTIFTRDDIQPLLHTALPGMAELSALLAIERAVKSSRYDEIVVDTAPMGHTLRLFELPDQFARLLAFFEVAGSRDQILAEHFGGSARLQSPRFLEPWRSMVDRVRKLVGKRARLMLVTTPEELAVKQSLRSADALEGALRSIEAVILNRVVRGGSCAACRRRALAARRAARILTRRFPGRPLHVGEDSGSPVLGAENLARFGAHVFDGKALKLAAAPPANRTVEFRRAAWPVIAGELALVAGKGGVGKTTVASGLAVRARKVKDDAVTVCSVDPAPSLDDIFRQDIGDRPTPVLGDPKLRACEMDAARAFAQWVESIRARIDAALTSERSGVHLDLSFERRLFSALLDIVPPGVDEVFAVFRIVDLVAGRQRAVIDMAPTGHGLELLRLPDRMVHWSRLLLKSMAAHRTLALARDVAVEIAEFGQRARDLAGLLKDGGRSRLWVVMLAEALPDRETERLVKKLAELKLPVAGLFVNRVLFAEEIGSCARCLRARRWQMSTLRGLSRRARRGPMYVIRNFPSEIAGKSALRRLTSELWQLA